MLKQRHSSSGLSSKTLSRSKFINKTINQNHNVSTESGKQGKTLRYPVKNKSCLIPRHLAQSTQSHIINSNQSNMYKTNNRNQQSQKMQNNVQNTHPNIQKNTSQIKYNMKPRVNLVQSKLTQPQMNFRSSQFNKNQQLLKYGFKPFLSVPAQQSHIKGNILSRLSDLTQNISQSQLIQQKIPYEIQKSKNKNINHTNNHNTTTMSNIMMRQKILQKQVKQSFLYKNMELTKSIQQMHRFCMCVNELKWICEQVNVVIKKYNQQIIKFCQQHSMHNRDRNDLQNILQQSQQLLKRFTQLQMLNQSTGPLFNFHLFTNNHNNNTNNNLLSNNASLFYPKIEKSHINNFMKTENEINQSPQNNNHLHSWSKLIENIQQCPLQSNLNNNNHNFNNNNHQNYNNHHNIHTAPAIEWNKNTSISINTFQLTQTNSPYKNKTLNQLIRLSQLRKTQFLQHYNSSSSSQNNKENNPNQINHNDNYENVRHKNVMMYPNYPINQTNHKYSNLNNNNNAYENNINNNNTNDNRLFTKKQTLFEIGLKHISPQKDPFDSIHLPHFNNNNTNNKLTIIKQQQQYHQQQQQPYNMCLKQKQFYEQQILRLNKIIQIANQQNSQLHKIMDRKYKQLQRSYMQLKQQFSNKQQLFGDYKRSINKLVEKALNELVSCGRLNNNDMQHYGELINNKTKQSYSMNNLCDIERRQQLVNRNNININSNDIKSIQQPIIIIDNKSFFTMVNCLQEVFRINDKENKNNNNDDRFQTNKVNSKKHNNNNNKNHTIQLSESGNLINNNKQTNNNKNDKNKSLLQKQKQTLLQQIRQLKTLKLQLQQQIIKQQKIFNLNNIQQKTQSQLLSTTQQYNQLTQLIFTQAFTIEDMLQFNNTNQDQEQNINYQNDYC